MMNKHVRRVHIARAKTFPLAQNPATMVVHANVLWISCAVERCHLAREAIVDLTAIPHVKIPPHQMEPVVVTRCANMALTQRKPITMRVTVRS